MHRRAQVTLFLIIGIALIIGLGYTMYNNSISKRAQVNVETEKLSSLKLQINPLSNFMNHCVNDILKNQLTTTGLNPPSIASALQTQIQTSCDLNVFQERGLEIQTQKPEVQVEIRHNQVILIHVKYPLTLKNQEESITVKDFVTNLPLKTEQKISYDPTNPLQTSQSVTLLSSDAKFKVEIIPGTQFTDPDGNPISPPQLQITLQDSTDPSVPQSSQVHYKIELLDATGHPILDPIASNPADSQPIKTTYYTETALASSPSPPPAFSYHYDDNPAAPHWEADLSTPSTTELYIPTPKQAKKLEDLTQKILSSKPVESLPPPEQNTLQQQFDQLLTTTDKTAQNNLLTSLQGTLPIDEKNIQKKFNDVKNIYDSLTPTTQITTTAQTSDFKKLKHTKTSPTQPHQPPVEKTQTETFNTLGFEETTSALIGSSCNVIGDDCCPGNLCQGNLQCEDGICQACTPDCIAAGKTCGEDGCGGSCGLCLAAETCQDGQCISEPTPELVCGDGTCQEEENCGTCPDDCGCPDEQTCSEGQCLTPEPENNCTPNCLLPTGNPTFCGFPDGCGDICSDTAQRCPSGQFCKQGQCISNTNPGCEPDCNSKTCGASHTCGGNGKCIIQDCSADKICYLGACRHRSDFTFPIPTT